MTDTVADGTLPPSGLAGASRLLELVRFGLIGVVNTGVYLSLFVGLNAVLPYLAAHVIAFGCSVVGSFFLNCAFTFRVQPSWRRFARFPLVNSGTFVMSTLGVTTLVEVLHLAADVAALVSSLASVPLTFVLARLVLVGHLRARH